MGRIWRSLSVGFGLLVASTTLSWADPVAQVVRLSGAVELTRDRQAVSVALGTALEIGDLLHTQDQGRVRIQLIDGSTINLGSQSELLITAVTSGGAGTERQIELDMGSSGALRAFAAPATPKSRFEIRTPLAVTAVRGTDWGIFSSTDLSEILIVEGRVGIRRNIVSGETGISLTGGRAIGVTADALGQPTRLSAEQLAALDAATSIPGTDIPFDPAAAPAPVLTPTETPTQEEGVPLEPEQPAEEQQEQSEQTPSQQDQDCIGADSDCKPKKPRKDKNGGGAGGGRGY